jgi:hypothetical protein
VRVRWELASLAARASMLAFSLTLVARGPQRAPGLVAAQSPPLREAGSGAVGHMALRSPPNVFRAMGHVTAPEPTLAGRQILEPLDT